MQHREPHVFGAQWLEVNRAGPNVAPGDPIVDIVQHLQPLGGFAGHIAVSGRNRIAFPEIPLRQGALLNDVPARPAPEQK